MEEAAPAGEEDELEGGSRDRTAGEPSRRTALIDRKECETHFEFASSLSNTD